jgi:hypothetical protein
MKQPRAAHDSFELIDFENEVELLFQSSHQ